MTTNRKLAIATAALIGASLMFTAATPSSARPETRFDVCPAMLSEPICDLMRSPKPDSNGSGGTRPAAGFATDRPPIDSRPTTARVEPRHDGTTAVTTEEQTAMKRTITTTTSVAALIGAALVIATPTPSGATSPTRWDVCPAIVDEPLCDLVDQAHTTTNGSGTKPAVVPEVNRTPDAGLDMSCGGTLIAHVQICVA